MVSPGLLGSALDRRWGTSVFTPAGFLLGIVLATTALLVLAKKLTPPARGNPLPLDDLPLDDEAGGDADSSKD